VWKWLIVHNLRVTALRLAVKNMQINWWATQLTLGITSNEGTQGGYKYRNFYDRKTDVTSKLKGHIKNLYLQ
jgi:hypothetical protein